MCVKVHELYSPSISDDLINGSRLESVDLDILEAFRLTSGRARVPVCQHKFLIDKTLGKLDISGDEKAAILGLILRVQHKL